MKKHIIIYIFLFLAFHFSYPQNAAHLNFWSRISLVQPLNDRFKGEVEVQHRRQNNYALQMENLLYAPLLSSVRTWAHYKHNENINFSISPFAYYRHNAIILNENDKNKPQTKEIRFSAAIELKYELLKNIKLIERTCFEYRDFQATNLDVVRVRNRLGLQYIFNNQWNITTFNEVFLNVKGISSAHIFDHNRFSFMLTMKATKNIRIETGYMYINRLPKNSEEYLYEHNFLVHLYFTLRNLHIHQHS